MKRNTNDRYRDGRLFAANRFFSPHCLSGWHRRFLPQEVSREGSLSPLEKVNMKMCGDTFEISREGSLSPLEKVNMKMCGDTFEISREGLLSLWTRGKGQHENSPTSRNGSYKYEMTWNSLVGSNLVLICDKYFCGFPWRVLPPFSRCWKGKLCWRWSNWQKLFSWPTFSHLTTFPWCDSHSQHLLRLSAFGRRKGECKKDK